MAVGAYRVYLSGRYLCLFSVSAKIHTSIIVVFKDVSSQTMPPNFFWVTLYLC